eukprot:scaffold9.g3190.t1
MSHRQPSLVEALLPWAAYAVLGVELSRMLAAFFRRERYRRATTEELAEVAASAHLIAAWRAIESLEPEGARLFCDPLAGLLAGGVAVHRALQQAQPMAPAQDAATGAASGRGTSAAAGRPVLQRRLKVSNPASRVWWFDQQILRALQQQAHEWDAEPASSNASRSPIKRLRLRRQAEHGSFAPQVVVLGAGMDSRPWRLESLPEVRWSGVAWFEVDQPGSVAEKQGELELLGAALAPGASNAAHPLRVATWTQPSWLGALRAAGFDPAKPTVWVAEGLLMYLTASERDALLRQLAGETRQQHAMTGASAPGSFVIAHNVTEELLTLAERRRQRQAEQDALEQAAREAEGLQQAPAGAQAGAVEEEQECCMTAGAEAAQAEGVAQAQEAAHGEKGQQAAEEEAGAAGLAAGAAGEQEEVAASYLAVFSPRLVATWRSGFPADDPAPLLRQQGWHLQAATTRARIGHDIAAWLPGGQPAAEVCAFETRPDVGEDRYARFVIARRRHSMASPLPPADAAYYQRRRERCRALLEAERSADVWAFLSADELVGETAAALPVRREDGGGWTPSAGVSDEARTAALLKFLSEGVPPRARPEWLQRAPGSASVLARALAAAWALSYGVGERKDGAHAYQQLERSLEDAACQRELDRQLAALRASPAGWAEAPTVRQLRAMCAEGAALCFQLVAWAAQRAGQQREEQAATAAAVQAALLAVQLRPLRPRAHTLMYQIEVFKETLGIGDVWRGTRRAAGSWRGPRAATA